MGFLCFFAAAFAETKRAPFDVPEGESEIIGYFVEYSGMKFGLFMISEFVEVVILAAITTAIFFGGWHLPFWDNALGAWLSLDLPRVAAADADRRGALYATMFWVKVILLCYAPAGHPLDVPPLPLRPDPDAGLEDPPPARPGERLRHRRADAAGTRRCAGWRSSGLLEIGFAASP